MAGRRLILTRPEFASFLRDPRQIREFERLFDTVTEHDALIEENSTASGDALSAADLALGLVAGIQELVDLLSTAPVRETIQDAPIEPPGLPFTAPDDLTPPTVLEPRENDVAPPQVPVVTTEDVAPPVTPAAECCENLAPLPQQAPIPDDLLFAMLAPPPVPAKRKRYGAFHSEVTQVPTGTNVNTPVLVEVVDVAKGITTDGSKLTVDTEGVYNVQFSVQLTADNGCVVMIWPQVNGVNVPWSNSLLTIQNSNDPKIPAWNWLLKLNAGDSVQLFWRSSNHIANFTSFPAADSYPAIPSVIVTIIECTGDSNNGGNS